MLGKIAQTICLIEVYRNAVNSEQIWHCLSKLADVKTNPLKYLNKGKKEAKEIMLWIITPTISKAVLAEFGAESRKDWESGIYFPVKGFCIGIIAVHQLPKTRTTLWLRLFGREKVQFEAIEELESLSDDYPSRKNVLKSVYGLLNAISNNRNKSSTINQQTEVLIMSLRAIFEEELAKEKKQGLQQGKSEGKLEGEIQGKLKTVPLLIQLGMTVEEIADHEVALRDRLELPLESVRNASNQ